MKKVLLIGDSIRMGYDKYVKEALKSSALVYYPNDNCRFAAYVLRCAHEWADEFKIGEDVDLVHWNAGLWDCLELFGDGPMTPINYYKETIPRIDRRLRMLFPNAKFVFATSTAVLEDKCPWHFKRSNSTIESYNKAALEALLGTDTKINDLYSLSASLPEEYHSDAVHYYTDKATEIIGGRVLSVISEELEISADKIDIDDFKPENYSKNTIGG